MSRPGHTLPERILGLSPGDLPPLARLGAVHALLGAAVAAGDATVQSVFLARAGADALPWVLLARALTLPLLAAVYARLARGRSARAVLAVVAVLAAVASVGARLLMPLGALGSMGAYALHEVASGIVIVHWGVYLLAGLRGGRALRGVSLVYAGARLGGAAAGGLLVWLFGTAGAPEGMWLVAGAFLLAAPLALALGERTRSPDADEGSDPWPEDDVGRPSMAAERRSGAGLFRGSPLLLALVIATVLMVWVRFVLRYQQQTLLQALPERELAQLLASYAIGANLLTAVLQVVVMTRLLPRVGVTRTNAAYAAITGLAQVALLAVPGVGAAFAARFADDELKHAVKTPISSLFYEAFPHDGRAGARAIVLGVASPAAQAVGALLLALVVAGAPLGVTGVAGAGLCLAFGGATLAQNRSYERAIARDRVAAHGGDP